MYKNSLALAARIWINACLALAVLAFIPVVASGQPDSLFYYLAFVVAMTLGSIPIAIVMTILLPFIRRQQVSVESKRFRLYAIIFAMLAGYGLAASLLITQLLFHQDEDVLGYLLAWLYATAILSIVSAIALFICRARIASYFDNALRICSPTNKSIQKMEHQTEYPVQEEGVKASNKIMYKGIITGLLILVMMIPAFFINNLVQERKQRQREIVEEVSSKWGSDQTISGFYLSVPYDQADKDEKGNPILIKRELIIFPESQDVSSELIPEIRPRSIYKVLLYRSKINFKGQYKIVLPKDIDPTMINWANSSVCLGLTDIKGIEEKVVFNFNGQDLELSPGLPSSSLCKTGLFAGVNLEPFVGGTAFSFNSDLMIRGSEKLHFLPLAGNSRFAIQSVWNSPSFDGNYLPGTRVVNDSGFKGGWSFNKANLPFGTTLKEVGFEPEKFSFGVTMVQPSDQYAKTERSVKYAILFIGLTFSLFFIIELLQKNPVHPVQYVLIGIALVIFYSLLLSISEFIAFDFAYLVAAGATILLITLYAKSHFRSWKTGSVFGLVLAVLYGFTFILVRLEDTALLIGSIGLFIILALAMYASRKINWYGHQQPVAA